MSLQGIKIEKSKLLESVEEALAALVWFAVSAGRQADAFVSGIFPVHHAVFKRLQTVAADVGAEQILYIEAAVPANFA